VTALGGGQARVQWTDNSNDESNEESNFDMQREQRLGNVWMNSTVAGTVGSTKLADSGESERPELTEAQRPRFTRRCTLQPGSGIS